MMRRTLQERLPCPELDHKKVDIQKALGNGWIYEEGVGDTCELGLIVKGFFMHGVELPVFIVFPRTADCSMWGEIWKVGTIMSAVAGEVEPPPRYSCAEWPTEVMDQVKSEVLAPALPPLWVIAAIVGCIAVSGLVLVKVTK